MSAASAFAVSESWSLPDDLAEKALCWILTHTFTRDEASALLGRAQTCVCAGQSAYAQLAERLWNSPEILVGVRSAVTRRIKCTDCGELVAIDAFVGRWPGELPSGLLGVWQMLCQSRIATFGI
ncbi:MAG: hypothetical protein AAF654_05875 [Myxococcota bacterium]